MAYRVKELFPTLQGEGARTGRAAVFCRFTGCNLWSGHEEHRSTAVCQFCDTDFVGTDGPGGGVFATAEALAAAAEERWIEGLGPDGRDEARYVVCTGGEPLLQLDEALIDAFHDRGFEIAIETNGTKPVPAGIDWVCVSPKAGAELVVTRGDELKVVVPQEGLDLDALAQLDFVHRFAQPMDGRAGSTEWAVAWCRAHPAWRLSLQTHKLLGIP
jgi:7-carboxy-7-deazaguanine synthase